MTTSRAQFDADRYEEIPTTYETRSAATPHEVFCQFCNRPLFIDDETLSSVNRQIEQGLDEMAFTCEQCRLAEDEIART